MRIALIGSDRLYKIQKPLEYAGFDCIIIKNIRDVFKKRFDAVIVDIAGFQILLGWFIKILNHCPLFYRARGDYTREISKIKSFLVTLIIKNTCDGIIFVSHSLKKKFIEKRIHTKHINVVKVPKNVDKHARKDKTPVDTFTIVTLTNFDYFDKIDILTRYVDIVNSFLLRVGGTWYIAGNGKYAEYFREKVDELKKVFYIGYVNTSEILSKASLMVYLSEQDALPNAVLEGMAAGLPVIVNNYEPLRKLDYVIVAKNEKELTGWLQKLYENPALRRKIGLKGHKHVEKKYNQKIIGTQYRKFLVKLI